MGGCLFRFLWLILVAFPNKRCHSQWRNNPATITSLRQLRYRRLERNRGGTNSSTLELQHLTSHSNIFARNGQSGSHVNSDNQATVQFPTSSKTSSIQHTDKRNSRPEHELSNATTVKHEVLDTIVGHMIEQDHSRFKRPGQTFGVSTANATVSAVSSRDPSVSPKISEARIPDVKGGSHQYCFSTCRVTRAAS